MKVENKSTNPSPSVKIKVIGVGGGGSNAVDGMIDSGMFDPKILDSKDSAVETIAINTDVQALKSAKAGRRILIGEKVTHGWGAGGEPSKGAEAAKSNAPGLTDMLSDANMVIVVAGMGGGTGTGAAPIIAGISKEQGILTIAVVTTPFAYEGGDKMDLALDGIKKLKDVVDAYIVIPNQKLFELYPDLMMDDALTCADEILAQSTRAVSSILLQKFKMNVDFADLRKTLEGKGQVHIGMGYAKGEHRLEDAIKNAISSPLLGTSIERARSVVMTIVAPKEGTTAREFGEAMNHVRSLLHPNVFLKNGYDTSNPNVKDEVWVTVVATGFEDSVAAKKQIENERKVTEIKKESRTIDPFGGLNNQTNPNTKRSDWDTPQKSGAWDTPFKNATPPSSGPSVPSWMIDAYNKDRE